MERLIGEVTNNVVEVEALIEGLLLCKDLKIRKLEIEGDSVLIVNALRSGSTQNWRLNNLVSRALEIIKLFKTFTTNHIYGEGNTKANSLANLGVDGVWLARVGYG